MSLEVKKLGAKQPERITIAVFGAPKTGKTTFGAKLAQLANGLVSRH